MQEGKGEREKRMREKTGRDREGGRVKELERKSVRVCECVCEGESVCE